MPLKKYDTVIEHFIESTTLAQGKRLTVIKLENKTGKLKQFSFRTTQLGNRLIIKPDNGDDILFPTGTQIVTNHVMTSQYSPQCFFAHKSAASPYGFTSTYEIEFENSIEIIIISHEATASATITDVFGVFEIYTDEYKDEKAWFD